VQWHDRTTGSKKREPIPGGVFGSITIEQARTAARVILGRVAQGHDPVAERQRHRRDAKAQRAADSLTLEMLVTAWETKHLSGKRPKYAKEAPRALRFTFKGHLQRPAVRLTHDHVEKALEALEARGRGTMAARTAAYGRACFKWASARKGKAEHVASNPFLDFKPAAPGKDRQRVITEPELREIWDAAGQLGYPFGAWTRFAMLTLQRGRQECAAAKRPEISPDLTTWTIPPERMKNGRAHTVHLSAPARGLVQSLPQFPDSELLFTTTGKSLGAFSQAKRELDRIIAERRAEQAAALGTKPTVMPH
jgi:integrase